jgi:hypothetical protein
MIKILQNSITVRNFGFVLAFFISYSIFAQQDAKWVMGYNLNTVVTDSILTVDFKTAPVSFDTYRRAQFMQNEYIFLDIAPSNICDKSGDLLFYSDGLTIYNKNHETVQNGTELFDFDFNNLWQGSLFLPLPGHPDSTLFFTHKWKIIGDTVSSFTYCFDMHFSLIDHKGNQGKGKVVDKMQVFNTDTIVCGGIKAAQHANGRDWWFLIAAPNGDLWYRYLLTPDGLQRQPDQQMDSIAFMNSVLFQSSFSPDANWFARYDFFADLSVFSFDRCSGLLEQKIRLHVPDQMYNVGGVAFSPNSRFLYVATTDTIYQFDMQQPDFVSTKTVVGVWDGVLVDVYPKDTFSFYWPLKFFMLQLAADGKIYGTSPGVTSNYMHVIHNPNEAGIACNFEQRGFYAPVHIGYATPNLAHFNTGKLAGSACDTLSSVAQILNENPRVRLLPNPFFDHFVLKTEGQFKNCVFLLHDAQGKLRYDLKLPEGKSEQRFEPNDLEPGVYYYQILSDSVWASGKLVKI